MTLIFRLIIQRDIWIFHSKVFSSELKTLEWWISGLMLNPNFFLISRLNMACSPHEFNSRKVNRSGLRISHSKVFRAENFRMVDISINA